MKNLDLNKWMWKWHFIAGLISLPFIMLLSITGAIYLFNHDVETSEFKPLQEVKVTGQPLSYQEQWSIAKENAVKTPVKLVIGDHTKATQFISGMFGGKSTLFVNPYTGEVTGEVVLKDTWMHLVRKLHGELLLNTFGTTIVEIIACWMVVLIITGIYIWWPKKKWKLGGFFTIRTKVKKRLIWRDLHAVLGFWLSVLLFITLAGGLPWTNVWGGAYKKIQDYTNSGFPSTWNNRSLKVEDVKTEQLSLDKMVMIAKGLNLSGETSIDLPNARKKVFSISNVALDLYDQKVYHFNSFSGELIKQHKWDEVGAMMKTRMWVMRFHEGELGVWNWWVMFFMAVLFTFSSVASLFTYLLRKKKHSWGVPEVPVQFKVGKGILVMLMLLGVLFPLFGFSVLLIIVYEKFKTRKIKTV